MSQHDFVKVTLPRTASSKPMFPAARSSGRHMKPTWKMKMHLFSHLQTIRKIEKVN